MPVIVYTGGTSPFEDIHAFAARVRAIRPGITDRGVSQAVKRALGLMRPRMKNRVVSILGDDIMAEDVTAEAFWTLLPYDVQAAILSHPRVGGAAVQGDSTASDKLKVMRAFDRSTVNRSSLVARHDDRRMSRTYVWSLRTNWEQEMTDDDWSILLSYPQLKPLFVRADSFRGYSPVRAYSHIPMGEPLVARDTADVQRLQRHFRRSHHHTGVDVPKG